MSCLSFSPSVGGPGTHEALLKVVNLSIQRWKSPGEMSRGRVDGSAVAEILIHLLTSGLGAGGGGGTYSPGGAGLPPDASAR